MYMYIVYYKYNLSMPIYLSYKVKLYNASFYYVFGSYVYKFWCCVPSDYIKGTNVGVVHTLIINNMIKDRCVHLGVLYPLTLCYKGDVYMYIKVYTH